MSEAAPRRGIRSAIYLIITITIGIATGQTQRCLVCHGNPRLKFKLPDGTVYQLHVNGKEFQRSVHGNFDCTQCHTNYRIRHPRGKRSADGLSDIDITSELKVWLQHVRGHNRPAVAACIQCHRKQFEEYRTSIHAETLQRGSLDAPMCTDCHGYHYILPHQDIESSTSRANVPATCGQCHANATVMRKYGVSASTVVTYRESFHGKKHELGSQRAAVCSSCHGYHKIRATEDPNSPLHISRRAHTCSKCHKWLGQRFAVTFTHQHPTRTAKPLVYWIDIIFQWFVWIVITALLLYTLADVRLTFLLILRSATTTTQGAEQSVSERQFMRWNIHQRLQHLMLMVSVIILMLTGLPLKGSTTATAHFVISIIGGVDRAAILHRIAAIGMMCAVGYHFLYLLVRYAMGHRRTEMLPTRKDFIDFWQSVLYLLGRRSQLPEMSHYNFVEKFLYWAAGWGIIMMGFTGIILWQAPWFAEHISPLAIEIAAVLHSHEALLATFALLVFHLYFAHLRYDVFPMSWVWLTGRISESELKERHALEYERLVSQGHLNSTSNAPNVKKRNPNRIGIALQFTAISIPLILVTVIIIALALSGHREPKLPPPEPVRGTTAVRAKRELVMKLSRQEQLRAIEGLYCFECHNLLSMGELTYRISFSHVRHIDRGYHCTDCHKDIGKRKHGAVPMDACMECHDGEHAPNRCTLCHARPASILPGTHKADWVDRHGQVTTDERECLNCHRKETCIACHQPRRPKDHTEQFARQHGYYARRSQRRCMQCHTRTSCDSCHRIKTPLSHKRPKFMKLHGKIAREGKECTQCHSEQFCDACHMVKLPHPKNYGAKHPDALKRGAVCIRCHSQNWCDACHGLAMPHPKDFKAKHGEEWKRKPNACAKCHAQSECNDCHGLKMPHPEDYRKAHAKVTKERAKVCARCHGDDACKKCHGLELPHPEDFALQHKGIASFKPDSVCFKCHKREETCAQCH
ncbi:MAG TPA: hypothetical protein EYP10_14125 [Armatimonadetes bacterium]|nr:hypothetical protein [Armatimonadota bacterium]